LGSDTVMPNAYDDLQPTSPEMQILAAGDRSKPNAYDDLAPPQTAPEAESKSAETPSVYSQLGRGAGLSARALIQGAVGLPGQIADAGHSVYDLATSPEARAATWEQIKHPSQWLTPPNDSPTQQFDRALDPYLPTPQTTGEHAASVPLSMLGGAMTPQISVPGASAPANFMSPAQQKAQLLAAQLKNAQDAGYVVPPSTTNPTRFNRTVEGVAGRENTQNESRAINQQARDTGAAQDLGLQPEVFTPGAVAAVKKEAGQAFQQARSIPRFNADAEYGADLDKVLSQNRGANADFPGASNPDVEKLVETYRQPSMTGNSSVSAVQLLRQKANDAYRNGQSELGAAYKGISSAIERQTERGALSLEQKPDPQQFSLDMGFANQGDISSRQLFDKTVPTTHGPEGVNGPMVYDPQTAKWSIQPQTQIKTVQEAREFGPSQQGGLPFSTRAPESFGPQPQAAPAGQYSTLIEGLRKARKTYAQASTIEEAMDPNGYVSGTKLASALGRGEPLEGNTLLAAQHAANYPKANLPANSSNVRKWSFGASAVGAAEGYHVGGVKGAVVGGALPLSSEGARAYLLSGRGQTGALPSAARSPSALAQALKARAAGSAAGAANAP
jgi:hypothetical protein